jgi:hypothetical protein
MEAQPVERVDDALDPLGPVPLLVGVLDPEDQGAARLLGDGPVVERRAGAADVDEARGRGRESNSDGGYGGESTGAYASECPVGSGDGLRGWPEAVWIG